MAPSMTTRLALPADTPTLAHIMTRAFSSTDTAYPLIWGSAGDEMHEQLAVNGLFTPLQREDRVTYVAVDSDGKILGFATWTLLGMKGDGGKKKEEKKEGGGMKLEGVNLRLLGEKMEGLSGAKERDVDGGKDLVLSFCFVLPEYQRQGIGSLLLEWGKRKADELQAKVWITSTPQGVKAYEKNGWVVKENYDIDLGKYGGEGLYSRAWMVRLPAESSSGTA